MDHSVCAVGEASLCTIPHEDLITTFRARPNLSFAVWRETLIDAAIFREAITNNSSRSSVERLAHFFSEMYFRYDRNDLVVDKSCALPLSQTHLGEMLVKPPKAANILFYLASLAEVLRSKSLRCASQHPVSMTIRYETRAALTWSGYRG